MINSNLVRKSSPLTFTRVIGKVLMFVVIVLVLGAAGLAASAIAENMRFASGLSQIINIVVTARNYAGMQAAFGLEAGEDLIASLARAGQISAETDATHAYLVNSWHGEVRATITAPSLFKINTAVPARTCRRIASVLIKSKNLGLEKIEVDIANMAPISVFNKTDMRPPRTTDIDIACNNAPQSTLVLTFHLR